MCHKSEQVIMASQLFYSYAREDEPLRKVLEKQLSTLKRQGFISSWSDSDIQPCQDKTGEIEKHLKTADIILLLISKYFTDSDYCYSVEMKRAIERHERGEAKVIPVILRPVYWQKSPFAKLQALPTNAKPVTGSGWHGLDEAFFDVAEGIRKAIEKLEEQSPHILSTTQTLEGHTEAVSSIAISPDGQTLVSGSWDKTIKVWHLQTGQLLHTLMGHSDYVNSVAISPDGQTLVSGSWYRTIKIRDLYAIQLLGTLRGHLRNVLSTAISPNGQILASGSQDTTINLWVLHTGDLPRTLMCHSESVYSNVFSPDGKTLISGSGDNTIKVWDVQTGEVLRTLEGHVKPVYSVAISPDGQTLVSGSGDNTVKVWNLQTGQVLRTLTEYTDEVRSVAFSPTGQAFAIGGYDGTIKIWGNNGNNQITINAPPQA